MPHSPESLVRLLVHPSQFPEAIEFSMRESLRLRVMNHKFHYDTPKQTLKWLQLHEAFSPARTDPDCVRIYDQAFDHCVTSMPSARSIEVVSLGSGGGQKEAGLFQRLAAALPRACLSYVPVDVSSGLALTSRAAALAVGVKADNITPVVIDLAQAQVWASDLSPALRDVDQRIVCFFGMLPNFHQQEVIPQLAAMVRPSDRLLMSANLAPGGDYTQGVQQILPLYDNALTRDWLGSVLSDLGVDDSDVSMSFGVVADADEGALLRIESTVTFLRSCRVRYGNRNNDYAAGEIFRLFFSYRHTPERLAAMLKKHGLPMEARWINASGEEGVFLVRSVDGRGK